MSEPLPTHARPPAGATASAAGTPAPPSLSRPPSLPMEDRALADALAQFAGVEAEAGADGLPLGLRQPDMVIDLEEFVSAVHSLQEETHSLRSGDCSMRSEESEGKAKPDHAAPAGIKLASAFLATFAAVSIGTLAKAAKAKRG